MLVSLALTSLLAVCAVPPPEPSPEAVVQKQVDAYNAHDLDAFVACYGDVIQFRTMDGKVGPEQGLAPLRKAYEGIFKRYPKVRVSVLKRICQGLFVIDQEEAEGMGPEPFTVTAIYETWHGKIVCVWFIQR